MHGSCVQESEQKTSLQLFSKSLDISKQLPIEQWLSNAKIEPSNDKKYGLQFFNYTLSSKLTKKYQLRCKTFDYEKRISIIDSINVCINKHSSEIIDCPFDFDSNCLEMIFYPTHLLDYKVNEEVMYRDMNYYRYQNYHGSYAPMFSTRSMMTGALIGAAIPAATLGLPAAYYYFKNQNKLKKNKYNYGGYPGTGASMPWYSSTAFSNSFAPPSPNHYGGATNNFGNLGGGNNLYPRQNYNTNYYPSSVYSSNKGFGHLNTPDLSPNFYSRNTGSAYPNYPSNSPYPSYPPPKYSPGKLKKLTN